MSLFDVIKYPIQDWKNLQELVLIPDEFIRPWAEDCLSYLAKDFNSKMLARMDVLQIHTAITAALFNSCRDRDGFLDHNKMDIYSYYFTRMLRKRIEDA